MPNCPTCGHFFNDFQWELQQRGVHPYNPPGSGAVCPDCGCLKSTAPTPQQRARGVQIDPWGQIVGFEGQPIRLKKESIEQHRSNLASGGTTTVYHQTSAEIAVLIMRSQEFKAGREGCVGAGMYFAKTAQETYPKTTKFGVILAVEVRLGRRFQVSLADSQNGTWPRDQSCQDSLSLITEHGCR